MIRVVMMSGRFGVVLGFVSMWFGAHFGIDLEPFRGGFETDLESFEGHSRRVFGDFCILPKIVLGMHFQVRSA